MKIYAKTDYDGCEYITDGKLYECAKAGKNSYKIIADDGEKVTIWFDRVGKFNWQRIEAKNLKEWDAQPGDDLK